MYSPFNFLTISYYMQDISQCLLKTRIFPLGDASLNGWLPSNIQKEATHTPLGPMESMIPYINTSNFLINHTNLPMNFTLFKQTHLLTIPLDIVDTFTAFWLACYNVKPYVWCSNLHQDRNTAHNFCSASALANSAIKAMLGVRSDGVWGKLSKPGTIFFLRSSKSCCAFKRNLNCFP